MGGSVGFVRLVGRDYRMECIPLAPIAWFSTGCMPLFLGGSGMGVEGRQ